MIWRILIGRILIGRYLDRGILRAMINFDREGILRSGLILIRDELLLFQIIFAHIFPFSDLG